ncbi:MAG TPA: PQQ-binding-like beta-propeller repeat protein [Acidimicrobiia bacterium]|jgi:outer membrane protein assembly factor BamB
MNGRGRWLAYGLLVALIATGCSQWTTYHHDSGRSGNDPSAASTIVPVAHKWTSPFLDGFVFAQPLVYHNKVYVATEHDTVYALDLSTGEVVWSRHLAEPMRATSVVCPLNIDPLGITGTPVIDTASNTIFAVTAELGPPVAHRLYGLDLDTGATRVDVSADPPGTDPTMDNQRPALALGSGRVYWGYGGEDCGQYHGKVVSMTTDGTDPIVYVVPTTNRGSIWSPSGPAIDSDGNVWVTTGDGTETTNFDHSTSVIKLSPTLQELGFFAPSNWASLNSSGLELGSTGPMMLPGGLVFQVGKSGTAYVINQAAPGGIGGQVTSLSLGCGAYGGNAFAGGMIFVPCTTGTRGVALDDGPTLRVVWRGPGDANGSPTFGGNAVWVIGVDSGTLYALNPTTGAVLQSIAAGHSRHFTSPTINGDTVIVATDHMVQAYEHTTSP